MKREPKTKVGFLQLEVTKNKYFVWNLISRKNWIVVQNTNLKSVCHTANYIYDRNYLFNGFYGIIL